MTFQLLASGGSRVLRQATDRLNDADRSSRRYGVDLFPSAPEPLDSVAHLRLARLYTAFTTSSCGMLGSLRRASATSPSRYSSTASGSLASVTRSICT